MVEQAPQEPAVARPASTVVFIRDGATDLEVYLIRRVKQMSFAGGMTAYPGGAVDPRDVGAHFDWVGPDAAYWAEQFRVDEALAEGLVAAAVRETFEEAGVLLATEPDGDIVDVSSDEWERERLALLNREHSLSELLQRRGLVLRADLMRPWAHWITPVQEPKRFDTAFFLARMPEGIHPRHISTEFDHTEWVPVQQAIAEAESGARPMLPPTSVTIGDLGQFRTAEEAFQGAPPRPMDPVEPTLITENGEHFVQMPDGTRIKPSFRIGKGRSLAD